MGNTDQCRDVLIEKNIGLLEQHSYSRLFLLSSIDREYYDRRGKDLSTIYEEFKLTYGDFSERIRHERESLKYSFDDEEALSVLTITGMPGAVDAWRECMIANKRGFFCWLDGDINGQLFTLNLQWEPPVGLGGQPLEEVDESIVFYGGNAQYTEDIPKKLLPGQSTYHIIKSDPQVYIHGSINAVAGNGAFTTKYFIPPAPKGIEPDPYYISNFKNLLIKQENIHGYLQWNSVYWQKVVWIAGVRYYNALGMHSPDSVGFAEFRIPENARFFKSVLGLARQDSLNSYGGGKCAGRVYINGELVWGATLNERTTVRDTPFIGIPQGASVLRLESDGLGDKGGAHLTWGDPYFTSKEPHHLDPLAEKLI